MVFNPIGVLIFLL